MGGELRNLQPVSPGTGSWCRCLCAGTLIAVTLVSLAFPAQAQEFRPGTWEGEVEFLFDFSRVETDTGASETTTENTNAEERLTIRNRGAYVFDPRLVTVTVGGTFGLKQGWSTAEADGSSFKDTLNTTLWGYETFVGILPGQAVSLNLFANRNQSSLSRELAGRTDVTTENRGLTLFAKRLYIPSTLSYRQELDDEETRVGAVVTRRKERRNIVTYEGRRGWIDSEALFRYQFIDRSDEINPSLDFKSHDGQMASRLDFGPELNWHWDSRLKAFARTGFSEETRFDVDQLLRIDHTERFRTQYRYFLQHTDRPEGNTTRHTGSFNARHRLYESLTTDLQLDAIMETVPNGEKDIYRAFLDLDYTKRLPGKGRLDAGLGGEFIYEDDQFDTVGTSVFDELHTFNPADPQSLFLNNRFVVTSSVVVTLESLGPPALRDPACGPPPLSFPAPLQEGVDYALRTAGDDITEIVPATCNPGIVGINPGDTIAVDYQFAVSPSRAFTTTTFHADVSVDYGWIRPFYRYEQQNQNLVSGQDGRFLNDQHSNTIGVELRYDGEPLRARFLGEAERLTADDRAFDTVRANQLLRYTLLPGLTLTLTGDQVLMDFSRPEDRQTRTLAGRAALNYALNASLFAELFAGVRDVDDTVAADNRTAEVGLRLRWIFGKLEVRPTLRFIDVKRGETNSQDYRATLRLIRRF